MNFTAQTKVLLIHNVILYKVCSIMDYQFNIFIIILSSTDTVIILQYYVNSTKLINRNILSYLLE